MYQPSNPESVTFMRCCLLELKRYEVNTPILIICEENDLVDVQNVNKLKKKIETNYNVSFGRMDFKGTNKEKIMIENIATWTINFK